MKKILEKGIRRDVKMKNFKSIIIYFSPAGTTRKIADLIAKTLNKNFCEIEMVDLADRHSNADFHNSKNRLKKGDCLWIGSPVYAGHTVPPIEKFISNLPELKGVFAVPFVTYGAVTSGIGLYEMGIQLAMRGFSILGAAKILAVHSMLWFSKNPPGNGHPGRDDEKQIKNLIKSVLKKISDPDAGNFINPKILNYQPIKVKEQAKIWHITLLRQNIPPIKLDKEKCTKCSICAEKCPVLNISLNPWPKIGDNCLLCFNCIRYCEPKALTNESIGALEDIIRNRMIEYGEPAETKIFI